MVGAVTADPSCTTLAEAQQALDFSELHVSLRIERAGDAVPIRCAEDACRFAASRLEHMDRECFGILTLDSKANIRGWHTVSIGTLESSFVHPREVFKAAILANAADIVLVHNHPSGDPTPSVNDVLVTEQLQRAGWLLQIPVMDHVIVGHDGRYFSMVEAGLLKPTSAPSSYD